MKKAKTKETPKISEEWLYLAKGEGALRRLYECLRGEDRWKAELWEDAGVLEIGLPDGGSMDLELLEEEAFDETLLDFQREQGADQVFAATFMQENQKKARQVMETLVLQAGGVFCRDSEEFLPRITREKEEGEDQ